MSIPFKQVKTKLGLDDILPFGRHVGYSVLEIIKDRPVYIDWLIKNTELKFYQSVHEELARQDYKKAQAGAVPKSYFYAGDLRGEQAHYSMTDRDESHNIYSDMDDWFDDVPF